MTRNGTDTLAIVVDDRRIPETEAELVAQARPTRTEQRNDSNRIPKITARRIQWQGH
jgi:hypothetical protein